MTIVAPRNLAQAAVTAGPPGTGAVLEPDVAPVLACVLPRCALPPPQPVSTAAMAAIATIFVFRTIPASAEQFICGEAKSASKQSGTSLVRAAEAMACLSPQADYAR
jgi:hypothetical protein